MLTQQELYGNWNEIKGRLMERWGQLTEQELTEAKGNVNQLIGAIQKRTGVAREKVEAFLESAAEEGSSFAERVSTSAQDYARQASDTLRDQSHEASEALRHQYEQASAATAEAFHHAQDSVRRHPAQSVAACFGIGLITGTVVAMLLNSRR